MDDKNIKENKEQSEFIHLEKLEIPKPKDNEETRFNVSILRFILPSIVVVLLVVSLYMMTGNFRFLQSNTSQNKDKEVTYTVAKISDKAFLDKIKFGTVKEIKEMLDLGANPNAIDENNRNAMIIASIFNGKPDVVKLLVDYGVNINHKDLRGYNALAMSSISGGNNRDFSKALIKNGIDINAKTNSGISVLMATVGASNDEQLVELLLKNGAEVNYKNKDGVTALMVAAKITTNPKIIEVLLKNGANKKDKDILGISVYDIAKSNKTLQQHIYTLSKLKF